MTNDKDSTPLPKTYEEIHKQALNRRGRPAKSEHESRCSMTDDAKQKREGVLPPCPFCGAHPHHGLSKVMYDGLHGDPYQRFQVWCPNGHARVDKVNREQAFAAWNTRQPQTDALKIARDAIIAVRHNAASTFTEEFSGQRGEDYDKAVLDCHAAVTAALKESK
jgi:hypothetical protein